MADGGISEDTYAPMRELEKYGAEVTIMVDESIREYTAMMDRMHACEYEGIKAAVTYEGLLNVVEDYDILCVHMTSVNREIIERGKNLKVVACLRGGYENVDVPACTERGIKVINSPWRSAPAVADFTVGMMIAENKNIARAHLAIMEGGWRKKFKNQAYIRNMDRCTVGIVGFGYIGRRVIDRLKGFGCKIVVHDPFLDPKVIADAGETPVSLDELLAVSDFVSLHLRYSEKTVKFFGEEQFRKMKPTAYFINTSRAAVVDEAALIAALREGRIAGAGLDVFEKEPLPADHPFVNDLADKVVITPHIGGATRDAITNHTIMLLSDIERYFKGEPMLYTYRY